MHWQYRTISRGPNSILHNLYKLLGAKTHDYISFYGLRAYGRLFDGGPVATSQVPSPAQPVKSNPYFLLSYFSIVACKYHSNHFHGYNI